MRFSTAHAPCSGVWAGREVIAVVGRRTRHRRVPTGVAISGDRWRQTGLVAAQERTLFEVLLEGERALHGFTNPSV